MRIFLTGATGFIGTAISAQMIAAGYDISGLTRSQKGAERLIAAGIEPIFGDITDPETLRRGVMESDGVIHNAFNHNFSEFLSSCELDRQVINVMAEALKGTQRPLLITSAVSLGSSGEGVIAVENHFNPEHVNPRRASEQAAVAALKRGANVSVIRLSQVHNPLKQGLITPMIDVARQKGISAYVGDGNNCWSAVHLDDAARLYLLALERSMPGSRYHAVAEQSIALRRIAEMIGRILNLPVVRLAPSEASEHFGWLSIFVTHDMSASSVQTQEQLKWQPKGPGLISDLEKMCS